MSFIYKLSPTNIHASGNFVRIADSGTIFPDVYSQSSNYLACHTIKLFPRGLTLNSSECSPKDIITKCAQRDDRLGVFDSYNLHCDDADRASHSVGLLRVGGRMAINDATATVGVTTMVTAPIAVKAQVPLVSVVLFGSDTWAVTIGDLGFIIGALLALTKLLQLIASSVRR